MTTEIEIPPCGVHCGVMTGREGHCDCELCHDGSAPVTITRSDLLAAGPKASMCGQWYAGIGDYRPWQAGQHQPPPPPLPTPQEMLARLTTTVPAPAHDHRCDSDLCHPDCAIRRHREMNDWDTYMTCPVCGHKTFLDAADPDDDLAAFWHHLGQHTQDPVRRLRLWTAAMGGEEAGKP